MISIDPAGALASGNIILSDCLNSYIQCHNPRDKVVVHGTVIAATMNIGNMQYDPNDTEVRFQRKEANVFFVSGNVGIGTPSPNSLLTLSSRFNHDPFTTFNRDGVNLFSFGLLKDSSNSSFRIVTNNIAAHVLMSVSQNHVGILTDSPASHFHSRGDVIVASLNILGSGASLGSDGLLNVSSVNVSELVLAGASVGHNLVPWSMDDGSQFIYRLGDFSSILIGKNNITDDRYRLDVSGNVNFFHNLVLDTLITDVVTLNSVIFPRGTLSVRSGKLFFGNTLLGGTGVKKEFSSSGNIVNWKYDDARFDVIASEFDMFWNDPDNSNQFYWKWSEPDFAFVPDPDYIITSNSELTVTTNHFFIGSPILDDFTRSLSHVVISANKETALFLVQSTIKNDNDSQQSYSFSVVSLNFKLKPPVDSLVRTFYGADFKILKDVTKMAGDIYGVYVDVSEVKVDGLNSSRGYRSSAIFQGDVGIGVFPERGFDAFRCVCSTRVCPI